MAPHLKPLAVPLGEVQAWRARLDADAGLTAACHALLSVAEAARAARFRFPRDRVRFTMARGSLRMLLGAALGQPPQAVEIREMPYGKPHVGPGLEFSVTHAGGQALFALARGVRVGVDLEPMDRDVDGMALARRYFHPCEVNALEALPPYLRLRAFLATWTRKEAIVKSTGEGLRTPLDSFRVTVDPRTPPRLESGIGMVPADWTLCELDAGPGNVATLALWRA